ncbi:MAG: sodium:calcium antiporter [Bacteroidota bacterium]
MLFAHFSTPLLAALFVIASAAIWVAGVKITKATDFIASYFKLGEAFGGMVFLAVVTNLPEIAITVVAAYNHNMDMAISNILGGIAMQTVVLVLIDIFGVGKLGPLSLKSTSLILLLEGLSLIFILTLVLTGKQFSSDLIFFRTTPFEWLIVAVWLGSIYLISKQTPSAHPHPRKKVYSHEMTELDATQKATDKKSDGYTSAKPALWVFSICAVVTLFAGWSLEETGQLLADRFDLGGVLFGATFLALATSLPEISTGITSARMKDYQMAVSDIFGGNAFLPVLFIVASMISGEAILPSLKPSDSYLTCIGIFLTGIYMVGMILRPRKQFLYMGIDSIIVLIVYSISVIGLLFLV